LFKIIEHGGAARAKVSTPDGSIARALAGLTLQQSESEERQGDHDRQQYGRRERWTISTCLSCCSMS
jgi:hypothetical protein